MITDSYSKMMSDVGMRPMPGPMDEFNDDIDILWKEQWKRVTEGHDQERERERELSVLRSGSAPPTVASGGGDVNGVPEEELMSRSDPAYIAYYYKNVNLNPRLPPPLRSKEDLPRAHRLKNAGVSNGDPSQISTRGEERIDETSLFLKPMGFGGKKEDYLTEACKDWGADGLIGLPGLGLGSRRKSIAEAIQDDISCPTLTSKHPSHSESQFSHCPPEDLSSMSTLHSRAKFAGVSSLQNVVSSGPRTYASALGASQSRSTTADPQHISRASSPCITPIGGGKVNSLENRHISKMSNDISTCKTEVTDLVDGLSGMSLSVNNILDEGNFPMAQMHLQIDNEPNFLNLLNEQSHVREHSYLNKCSDFPNGTYYTGSTTPSLSSGGRSTSQHLDVNFPNSAFSGHVLGGYGMNPLSPSMLENQCEGVNVPNLYDALASGTDMGASGINFHALGGGLNLGPNFLAAARPAPELQNLSRVRNQSLGSSVQNHLMDPLYLQTLRSNEFAAAQQAAQLAAFNDPTVNRVAHGISYMDSLKLQKAYISALVASQRSQYGPPRFSRTGSLNQGYCGSSTLGVGISCPGSPLAGQVFPTSLYGSSSPFRCGERNMPFPSGIRRIAGGAMGVWQSDPVSHIGGNFASSLLDEFKINKTKCFALSEIDGHVIEFSADQYGSRFIQQKLETATVEEKNMVFVEIMPHALSLMTDVFGNYVVQKFLELGSAYQIREMAGKLTGHVLTLSLQMYGCRVIQKAIEVVDLDQKTSMVSELDGHIMRCVRDQNGNHVIQKCIECVPEDAIQFMITKFYDQVVTLSTHPYGCRVIQRVLEHCHSPETQIKVMNEILESVCMLAQDQYGNYVVQHVLEYGKPDQRSVIIDKLTGNIVRMSQQKFASNVVEKCLTFGTPQERQILVNEILGSTDKNDPLQVLMKDQFANYVVQKVLETCDDHQLELILDRIKLHLNVLKKYTYGKHIVARVEKLVAAGERRIEIMSSSYMDQKG